MPFLLFFLPVIATLTGGLLAIRFRQWLLFLLSAGAGILLGAAFLDLLPEAVTLGQSAGWAVSRTMGLTLLSFVTFFVFESWLDSMSAGSGAHLRRRSVGRIGGGLLIFHSLRDGMAIGAAYAASHQAGYAVAVGIVAHDLGDGMNTVILTTGGEKPAWPDYLFLIADAIAPCVGGVLALWWFASAKNSATLLAVAAGFFVQMATSDLLPQVRQMGRQRGYAVLCVVLGVALIYAANALLAGMN